MSKFSFLDSWKHPVATALAVAAVSYFGSISTALAGRGYLGLFLFMPIKTLVMGVAIAFAVGVGSAHAADRFTTLDGIPAHVMTAQDMESVVGAGTLFNIKASLQSPVFGDPDASPVPTGGIATPDEAGGEGRVAATSPPAPPEVGLRKAESKTVLSVGVVDTSVVVWVF